MTSLSLNKQHSIEQHAASSRQVYIALVISIAMHFAIVRALPWLEVIETKLPITMMAELQQPPPPPPSAEAPTETQPIAPPTKQSVVRPESKPVTDQPKPQSQVIATPVLTATHAEPDASDYHVPEVQQAATVASDANSSVESAAATSSISSSAKNSASASSSTSTWDDSNVWDEYGRNLQRLCERYKQYPAIAVRRNWQGLAKVSVHFSAEGKTLSVTIEKSTGQKVLDEQAMETVKKSLNDLPVPNKFKGKEFRISVPIDFKLE